MLLTHKAVNNTAPEYLCDLIKLNVKSTTIRTRASFDPCLLCVPPISKTCANSFFDISFVYAAPTLWNALDLDIRLLPFDTFKKSVKTHLYLKYFVNWFLLYLYYLYDISVSTMCIYCDYCVYHYKSTELVSLYTLDIGLKINIIIIIMGNNLFPYNDVLSDTKQISHGVPQGLILGPLLFILYLKDFSWASDILFSFLFLDDTTVLIEGLSCNCNNITTIMN